MSEEGAASGPVGKGLEDEAFAPSLGHFWALFAVYMLPRLLLFFRVPHAWAGDSIRYAREARMFAGLEPMRFSPDLTPSYPFFSSLVIRLTGLDPEAATGLVSLISSVALFWVLYQVGAKMVGLLPAFLGLIFLAFDPLSMKYASTSLSEGLAVLCLYFSIWLFLRFENRGAVSGFCLGLALGVYFLTRVEGLGYGAVFFLAALSQEWRGGWERCSKARFALWTFALTLGALLLFLPQATWVSKKMGSASWNGRQAWVVIRGIPDGKTYDQKFYGLDYSPVLTNLDYLQANPDVLERLKVSGGEAATSSKLRAMVREADAVSRQHLGQMCGPLGLFFLISGLFSLGGKKAKYFPLAFLVLAFGLLVPCVTTAELRNFLAVLPMAWLLCGLGVVSALEAYYRGVHKRWFLFFAVSAFLLQWVKPHEQLVKAKDIQFPALKMRAFSQEIINSLDEPAEKEVTIVGKSLWVEFESNTLGRTRQKIVDIPLPATDYEGLLKYCRGNGVDYVAFRTGDRSFSECLPRMLKEDSEFSLVFQKTDGEGERMLFRLKSASEASWGQVEAEITGH